MVVEALEREEGSDSAHGGAQDGSILNSLSDGSAEEALPSQQRLTQGPRRQSSSAFNEENVERDAQGTGPAKTPMHSCAEF
eukprot:COSAG03_NODE_4167_length_1653_cov_3.611326_3_plen_81_part_00